MNKFESFPIVKALRENLARVKEHKSLSLICGVSGGVDSMVLLYLLHRFDVNCTVAHCNYQLRGVESDKDMQLVKKISALWGFQCITARFDPTEAEESNTQIWTRDLRYTMFRDLKRELNSDFIVTAHHREDQIETIVQKILRGAGPGAWSGMNLIDRDLFRPLLEISKEEIIAFAKSQHVPFRDDQTNKTSKYARNFIRNDLSPELDKLIPGWKQNILQIPVKANQFTIMTDILLGHTEAGPMILKRDALLALPEKIWPALIHRFIEKNCENGKVTSGELNQIADLADIQTGSYYEFGNNLRLMRDREFFRLTKPSSGVQQAVTLSTGDLPFRSDDYGIEIKSVLWDGFFSKKMLQLDFDSIRWPITVRNWSDGDRIQPLGMEGHKQIAHLLTDSKISAVQKKEAILIESFDGKICAVIFPHLNSTQQIGVISNHVKCTAATKQILLIDTDV